MNIISQDASSLLYQIRDRLRENRSPIFFFVEEIQSLAFGRLIGPDNIIPPTSKLQGLELQRSRQRIALALGELVSCGLVSYCGQEGGSKIYKMNGNESG